MELKILLELVLAGVFAPELNMFDTILVDKSYTEGNFAYALEGVDCHIAESSAELNSVIEDVAKSQNIKYVKGNMVCNEVFEYYVKDLDELLERFPQDLHIMGSEMEAFALFYVAKYLEKNASCLLTVVDSHCKNEKASSEDREKSLNDIISIALEASIKL